MPLLASTAIFQTIWLWRRSNKAWLWPLLSGNSAFALYVLLPISLRSRALNLSMPIALALLSGFVMHYILTHAKDTEKAKIVFDADDQSDDDRAERLQERDTRNPLWDVGDDQALQRDAL